MNRGEHILHGTRGHPWLRRRPHHGVRFARTSVSIREYRRIITVAVIVRPVTEMKQYRIIRQKYQYNIVETFR